LSWPATGKFSFIAAKLILLVTVVFLHVAEMQGIYPLFLRL
jgi:hypothetical protein